MKKVDLKTRFNEVKWTTDHSLTTDQRKSLIMEKVERAKLQLETRNRVFKSQLTA